MSITGKYIGINQRVPFNVLDQGLSNYLRTGEVNRVELKANMKQYTKGENRASKASAYAYHILTRPESILKFIKANISSDTYNRLPDSERKVLVLTLLAITYPIIYDFLIAMASGFKVQSTINKKFINQKMSALYGSNRAFDIAIDAIIPMLIELGAIQRMRISIYGQLPQLTLCTPIVSEAYIYTDIKLSGSKTILVLDTLSRPWYQFFVVNYSKLTHNQLLKFTDAPIGGGYLGIK